MNPIAWLILLGVLLTAALLAVVTIGHIPRLMVRQVRRWDPVQEATAARHAALPPVQVVRTTIVNERKALP